MTKTQWRSTALAAVAGLLLASGQAWAAETDSNKPKPEAAPLTQPEPAVSKQDRVNVRGQAAINSEVVTRLSKGQLVTVLEEVVLKKPKADEPDRWCRILLPTNVAVWVHGDFIDKTAKTVRPRLLNVRSGPGENYSVLNRIPRGTAVTVLGEKGPWLKIEPPPNTYGFVAAHLLLKGEAAVAAATGAEPPPVVTTPPATNVVAPPPVVAEVQTNAPTPPVVTTELTNVPPVIASEVTNVTPVVATNVPTVAPAVDTNVLAAVTNTPPTTNLPVVVPAVSATDTNEPVAPPELIRRVVTREGLLKGTFSIQAPSYFELRSLDNNRTINYVWSPTTNIVLQGFKGRKVLVTGEELLDERWPHTPVISVEEISPAP